MLLTVLEDREPELYETLRLKTTTGNKVESMVTVTFNSVLKVTSPANVYEGAIYLEIPAYDGEIVSMWLPKKCCANLNKEKKTILVWDVIWENKLIEFPELASLSVPYARIEDYPKPKDFGAPKPWQS